MKQPITQRELWQTTYDWLKATGNKADKNFCQQEITTHADYPALTSVADFLSTGAMEYTAAQADASYIHEFNYPVLAHIKQPGQEYMHIIPTANDWEAQKDITQHWSGVVLFANKGSSWHNAENEHFEKTSGRQKGYLLVAFLIFIGLFILAARNVVWYLALFGLLSIAGMFISILIIANELGVQNNAVKQVCGVVSKRGCEAVLKSKYAYSIVGFSIGDIAMIYFSMQLIVFLVGIFNTSLNNLLLWLSLPGIAIAGWSIYTQAVTIKHWCALCLGVVGVLSLQFFIAALNFGTLGAMLLEWNDIIVFVIITSILLLVLWPIKKQFIKMHELFQKAVELKKWKTDVGIFINQWEKEPEVDTIVWENDLIIGNSNAPIKITVACNPYCAPCAKGHKLLDEIFTKHKNKICIQIRMLSNLNNDQNKLTLAAKAIFQKRIELKTNQDIQLMLNDWFNWNDIRKWSEVWKPDESINVNEILKQHVVWMDENRIHVTPTLIFNGRKLPKRYNISDLDHLVIPLIEKFSEQN